MLHPHQYRAAPRTAGLLSANVLQGELCPVFVAVKSTDDDDKEVIYYAQIILCFVAKYLNTPRELVYVRWLHTARAVALAQRRQPSDADKRGPFESFRWALYPKGRQGHPREGGPWCGVVSPSQIMYRVHMVRSMKDAELFRLNTDVWWEYL